MAETDMSVGGQLSKSNATLRIYGDDLDPVEITRLLGAEPTFGAKKGDTRRTPTGKDVVALMGSWRLQAEEQRPGDLSSQVREIFAKISAELSIWQQLSKRYRCDMFCGLFMEAFNGGDAGT